MRWLALIAGLLAVGVLAAPAQAATTPFVKNFRFEVEGSYSAQGTSRAECLRQLPDNNGTESFVVFGSAAEKATFKSTSKAKVSLLRRPGDPVSLIEGRSGGVSFKTERSRTLPAGCTVDPRVAPDPVDCGAKTLALRFSPDANGSVAGTRKSSARVPIGIGTFTGRNSFSSPLDPFKNCKSPDGLSWFGIQANPIEADAIKNSAPTVKELFSSDKLTFEGTTTGKTCVDSDGRSRGLGKKGKAPTGCAPGSATTYTLKLKIRLRAG